MPDITTTVFDVIRSLLRHRAAESMEVRPDSDLHADLGFDSLELAELSAVLEDTLGRDPYTAGFVPRTVGEVVAFYTAPA